MRTGRDTRARLVGLELAELEAALGGDRCAEARDLHDAAEAKMTEAFFEHGRAKLRWEKIPSWNLVRMIREWNDVPNARERWIQASHENRAAFGERISACIRGGR